MHNPEKNDGFDWVTEADKCRPTKTLKALAELVRKNVETANALAVGAASFQLREDGRSFTVIRERDLGGYKEREFVRFVTMDGKTIRTEPGRTECASLIPSVTGTPGLNESGDCILVVVENGEEKVLRLYQFNMRALRDLFFGWRDFD